jgi:phosphoribosylaminoimidazolecarboxamide formyltransferase / IMP cyclohydrolase
MPSNLRRVKRALLSVSDKTGLLDFAKALHSQGIELISTGGTAKTLGDSGLPVKDISEVTGFPEMMDGRVKTLHPKVHGGLLAIRGNPEHEASMLAHGIDSIDLLVVNLYPFEETIQRTGDFSTCIENIDVGGPAMIRGAAKNHSDVAVITDTADYGLILSELSLHQGSTTLKFRRWLAAKAFARTASYDSAISNWFADEISEVNPEWRAIGGPRIEVMRYGENPHQSAAFYKLPENDPGIATARQVQGKQLSFNNINDTNAALECVSEFDPKLYPAAVIVKHANPAGAAVGSTLVEAYHNALRCDPVSAFGGIVALNRRLDVDAARAIVEIFTEVIIAPEADEDAIAVIAAKKNLRLLVTDGLPNPKRAGFDVRSVSGGFLVQSRDNAIVDDMNLKVVTKRSPTQSEFSDMQFAFRVAKHVKSNAIVYAKNGATVGIGAGQMSRIDSARIAAWKAADAAKLAHEPESLAKGSVVASDAFFPFADGLIAAVEAGATAVIQPGGSMRDDEVIAAADAHGIAMVFTDTRHFRH